MIMQGLQGKYGRRIFCFKVHGSQFMMVGLPDIICCYRGRFFAFETKMDKGKASKIQLFIHTKIRAAGGVVEVIRTLDEAIEIIEAHR